MDLTNLFHEEDVNLLHDEDTFDYFFTFDEYQNLDIHHQHSNPHINNLYSLSRNSRRRRLFLYENYLFGRRRINNDLTLFLGNKYQKLKKEFGKFFTQTILNLHKKKLLTIFRLKSGYKHLLLLYQYYLNKKKENKDEEFLKCFPSLRKMYLFIKQDYEHFNDKKSYQNLLFTKIFIDLYNNYMNLTENTINYKKKKLFFKFAIEFFKKISPENFNEIKWNITSMNLHFYTIKAHEFYLEMNEKKYIEYFNEKEIKLRNLIGGIKNIDKLFYL
jgi:hypothetical protein